MRLSEFNAAPDAEAVAVLLACAHVESWARVVAAGRPYPDVDAVVAAAAAAPPWDDDEIDAALARHPRIGERARGDDADAAMSRTEQSAVGGATDDVQAALAEGNRAYEERFGHVFLVRAAGRSAEEILAALRQRSRNTPEQERANAAANLREIALLRIAAVLRPDEPDPTDHPDQPNEPDQQEADRA